METYTAATRYEGKIETFDPCIINVTTGEREITSNVIEPTTIQSDHQNRNQDHTNMQEEAENSSTIQVTAVQSNAQSNMTLTPVRLPAILDGEYYSVIRIDDSNVTVKCLACQKLLNGNLKSTGNFLSHIKRVHPNLIEKIKTKSHQRKPAVAYIDTSAEKSAEIVTTKKGYRKCYTTEENNESITEVTAEPPSLSWQETTPPQAKKRREEDTLQETPIRISHTNSYQMEDEFDAIGRNVAAKLRSMRLDQRIVAEKLLNDVLFEAQLGTLHREARLHV